MTGPAAGPSKRDGSVPPLGGVIKKKKRTLGRFPCPDCEKIFSRSDHLARHHLNHKPKEVFECDYYIYEFGTKRKCGKTFVRKDLKERHIRRHLDFEELDSYRGHSKKQKMSQSSVSFNNSNAETLSFNKKYQYPQAFNIVPSVTSPSSESVSLQQATKELIQSPTERMDQIVQSEQANHLGKNNESVSYLETSNHSENEMSYPHRQLRDIYSKPFNSINNYIPQSQNDILSWLFNESPPNAKAFQDTVVRNNGIDETPSTNLYQSVLGGNPNNYSYSHQEEAVQYNLHSVPFSGQMSDCPQPSPSNTSSDVMHIINEANGLQNVSIFSNEHNPLDELFLKNNFAQGTSLPEHIYSETDTGNQSGTNLSSAVSNSPSSTIESNKSPDEKPIKSPEEKNPEIKYFERIVASHGENSNKANNAHYYVDGLLLDSIIKALPTISKESITEIFRNDENHFTLENMFSYYLYLYWSVFHVQFSILHKPSFNTKSSEPLLLLAMVLVGCNYSSLEVEDCGAKVRKKSASFKFGNMIAKPLRFMIFQHKSFKSPVKLWILQSLNLLEWSEKNFLSRLMHERAHIHHGTTVQLLRRSPLLGGNPTLPKSNHNINSASNTSAGEDESDNTSAELLTENIHSSDYDLFTQWVNSESMKRITFMTFYLDIMDYIKFRHDPNILFHQLQLLNLPCDDEVLWESVEVNGSFKKIVKRQKRLQQRYSMKSSNNLLRIKSNENFLSAIKKLLKYNQSSLKIGFKSSFTKKILFAGLVSILYQMQQTDLQNNNSTLLGSKSQTNASRSVSWKEVLSKAIDNWNIEMHHAYSPLKLDKSLYMNKGEEKTQCHYALYHLVQIIGMPDLNHYDIAIFGGSPANRSVNATNKDFFIVQKKLNSIWPKTVEIKSSNELVNLKSVIHCYLLLWELMIAEDDSSKKLTNPYLAWSVTNDYYDSMYAISIATLVLWSYNFSMYGIESDRYKDLEKDGMFTSTDYDKLLEYSAEGGYQYLHRVKLDFLTHLRKNNLHREYSIHPFKWNENCTPHEIVTKYCELLPYISNQQNVSGICFLVGSKLLNSQWEVIRENAKLILNCGFRSIGKRDALCLDLFDNEFSE